MRKDAQFVPENGGLRGRKKVTSTNYIVLNNRWIFEKAPRRGSSKRSDGTSVWRRRIFATFHASKGGPIIGFGPTQGWISSSANVLLSYAKLTKRQYHTVASQYQSLDPARGKRKRKALAEKLRDILEEFEAKADQIYALYDVVVEGTRSGGKSDQSRRGWLEL